MKSIAAIAVAAVTRFPYLNEVAPVSRSKDAQNSILLGDWCIIDGRQFETLVIKNGHVWVEQKSAESHGFYIHADPLPLRGSDCKEIHIFVFHDAVNR